MTAPFGYASHPTGKVVHQYAGGGLYRVAGRESVRWACGSMAYRPIWCEEPPPFRRMCPRCEQVSAAAGGVYFAASDGLIKIGCSTQPARRAFELNAELLASHPGDYEVERTLHRVFADDRAHGEWFHPSPSLLAYIARVVAEMPAAGDLVSSEVAFASDDARSGAVAGANGTAEHTPRTDARQLPIAVAAVP